MLTTYAFLALGTSFVCSVAEAVLLSITPTYIEALRERQRRTAELLARAKSNIERPLAAILSLNTVAHTAGAIGVGAQALAIWGSVAVGIASATMTILILVVSEIIPKTIGAVYWRELAPATVHFTHALTRILAPLVWLSEFLTRSIARDRNTDTVSRAEVIAMAGLGSEAGELESEETRVLTNLLALHSLTVRDIMTPRTVIHAFPQDMIADEMLEKNDNLPVSRLPIFDETLDKVTGFVLKSDVMLAGVQGNGDQCLGHFRRDLRAISSDTPLTELFRLLIDKNEHVALVVDEYGGTDGLVSMEDLIETLLGVEIVDEVDVADDMQRLARRQWAHRAKTLGLKVASRPHAKQPNGSPRR